MNTKSTTSTYLLLDLVCRICKEYGGVLVGSTHLSARSLQGWEEGRMEKGRLLESYSWGHVTSHPEVRILWEGKDK